MSDLLALARQKGTDRQYREWIQRQPSCISGKFSEWVNGEGRCIAAHVRRAGESGIAHKGEFACVPMTQEEHADQHRHGEAGCLYIHLGGAFDRDSARDWFDTQRIKYLQRWIAPPRKQRLPTRFWL